MGHEGILAKGIPGRGDSAYKVPKARCLAYSRNSKEAVMEPTVGEQQEMRVNRAKGHCVGSGSGSKYDRKPLGWGLSEGWGNQIRFTKGTLAPARKTRTIVEVRS